MQRETLSRNPSHVRNELGLLFHADEIFQLLWSQVLPKRQPCWQDTLKNVKVMQHYHGKNTSELSKFRARTWSKDCIHIRFLESSPVKQRQKIWSLLERRIKVDKVKSYIGGFMKVFIKKNLCSSELYKVSQATIWTYRRFLTQRLRKATHHFCTKVGCQYVEIHFFKRRTCTRRFWTDQRQESKVLLTRVTTGSESRPEVQAVLPLEENIMIDCLWLIWKRRKIRLNATKQRTVVSYVMTQFRPSSLPRSSTSKMEQKVSWKHHREKEKHHQKKKKKADAIVTHREDLRYKSEDREPLQTRPLGEILSIAEVF